MAASDAKAVPIKNSAYRVTFPILDADGDFVSAAAGLDSEVSIDGAAFADATSEATEIAANSGIYYLDLTAGEMNGDTIVVVVKTSTAGAKTTPLVLYTAARSINDIAYPVVSGRSMDVSASGLVAANMTAINSVATGAARIARSTQGIVLGTVASASTTSNIVTSSLDPAAAASDQFKGRIVTFEQGTTTTNLRGQSTDITASTPAGALTVTPLTTAPVSGDVFVIT
jgi:hypothetical protein